MAYRGKYPNKIKAVSSSQGGVIVVCNNGKSYHVKPVTDWGRGHIPKVGAFIHEMALTEAYEITNA